MSSLITIGKEMVEETDDDSLEALGGAVIVAVNPVRVREPQVLFNWRRLDLLFRRPCDAILWEDIQIEPLI